MADIHSVQYHNCKLVTPEIDLDLRRAIERMDAAGMIYHPNDPSRKVPDWVEKWLAEESREDDKGECDGKTQESS